MMVMNLEGNGRRLLLTEYTPCRTWQGVYSRPQGMSIPGYTHRHTHEEEKVLINLINLISASYAFQIHSLYYSNFKSDFLHSSSYCGLHSYLLRAAQKSHEDFLNRRSRSSRNSRSSRSSRRSRPLRGPFR